MLRTEQKVANMFVEIKDNLNLVSKELEDIKNIRHTVSKDLNELNLLRSKMIYDLNQLMSSVEKNISYQVKTITSDGCIYTFYNSNRPHLTVVCLNQIVVCGNMARYIWFNFMCI